MKKKYESVGLGKTNHQNNAFNVILGFSKNGNFDVKIDTKKFIKILFENESLKRRLGFSKIESLFDDIFVYKVSLLGFKKTNINVMFIFDAYQLHHNDFTMSLCDLVVSFIRPKFLRIYNSKPIWSFYRYEPNKEEFVYCLESDYKTNFKTERLDNDM